MRVLRRNSSIFREHRKTTVCRARGTKVSHLQSAIPRVAVIDKCVGVTHDGDSCAQTAKAISPLGLSPAFKQGRDRIADRGRESFPLRDHGLQISVERRQELTIRTASMQRQCSAALLAIGRSRNAIRACVEFLQGFKSPILHSKPFASDRKWLFALERDRHGSRRSLGSVENAGRHGRGVSLKPRSRCGLVLILFTESLDVRLAVRIEEFLAALLPR